MLANFDCIFMKIRSVKWKISLSFVLQYIKSWRMVSFIAAILFISAIFFTAHCGVTYQNFTRNALTYSPYDLFYVQYNDINNMEQKEIMQTLDKYDITITEEKRLGLLRNSFCNIISVDDVNKNMDVLMKWNQVTLYNYSSLISMMDMNMIFKQISR